MELVLEGNAPCNKMLACVLLICLQVLRSNAPVTRSVILPSSSVNPKKVDFLRQASVQERPSLDATAPWPLPTEVPEVALVAPAATPTGSAAIDASWL